jgi:hypothetical protein
VDPFLTALTPEEAQRAAEQASRINVQRAEQRREPSEPGEYFPNKAKSPYADGPSALRSSVEG